VGAGLGADRDAVAPGGGRQVQGAGRGQVEDVGPAAGAAGGLDDPGDGPVLGLVRPRPVAVLEVDPQVFDRLAFQLGQHAREHRIDQGLVGPGGRGQLGVGRGQPPAQLVEDAGAESGLEAGHGRTLSRAAASGERRAS
jgi:hypothetical protein